MCDWKGRLTEGETTTKVVVGKAVESGLRGGTHDSHPSWYACGGDDDNAVNRIVGTTHDFRLHGIDASDVSCTAAPQVFALG